MSKKQKRNLKNIIISAGLLILAAVVFRLLPIKTESIAVKIAELVTFAAVCLFAGRRVIKKAFQNVFSGRLLDENFLMLIASVGAFAIGEYVEGVAVMVLYNVGELFEDIAVGQSKKRISALAGERVMLAHVEGKGDRFPDEVAVGDIIEVKPGEKIPLDGIIIEGSANLDTRSFTGESAPVPVSAGDNVSGGMISSDGLLKIKVLKPFRESGQEKIIELVENSAVRKSKTERFITKFAAVYTPAVVICAVLLAAIPSVITGEWSLWVHRALMFLVVSCPCALVISIPMAFFAGIGNASRQGILVKGADYIERLAKLKTVVTDKTGTLTLGAFEVKKAVPAENYNENDLLEAAFIAESGSNHPISKSIISYCKQKIRPEDIVGADYRELPGLGVCCNYNGDTYLAGNARLIRQETGLEIEAGRGETAVFAAKNSKFLGKILLGDIIKDNAAAAVNELKALGVKRIAMLSGDNEEICGSVCAAVGIGEYYAGMLPEGKVRCLEKIIGETEGTTAYIGDGINDAPVLALADIGVAMGGIGQDAAVEAADCIIMNDDLSKLAAGVKISEKTVKIARENIFFAIFVKVLVLVLSAVGLGSMWLAVFGDVGVLVLAILNAMRAMK